MKPLGNLYTILKGKNSDLLVFGFLYNLGRPCPIIQVEEVEKVVQKEWFRTALQLSGNDVDAILVLAHMDVQDPLLEVICKAMRDILGDHVPIQFITGHAHYRGVTQVDDWSTSVEAGRHLDTVGFVSFPTKTTALSSLENNNDAADNKTTTGAGAANFQSVFLDANKEALATALGLNDPEEMKTPDGTHVSQFISSTRDKMGLTEQVGCAPADYFFNTPIDNEQLLRRLYRDPVVPNAFFIDGKDNIAMFIQKEAFRYDLLSHNPLVVDDLFAVAPFNDAVVHVGPVPGSAILQLNETMNKEPQIFLAALPNYTLIGDVVDGADELFHFFTHDFNVKDVVKGLQEILPEKTFAPVETEFSSTMLWLSFVGENWPCGNDKDNLPDWVPTPESVAKVLGREDDDQAMRTITIVMSLLPFTIETITMRAAISRQNKMLKWRNMTRK